MRGVCGDANCGMQTAEKENGTRALFRETAVEKTLAVLPPNVFCCNPSCPHAQKTVDEQPLKWMCVSCYGSVWCMRDGDTVACVPKSFWPSEKEKSLGQCGDCVKDDRGNKEAPWCMTETAMEAEKRRAQTAKDAAEAFEKKALTYGLNDDRGKVECPMAGMLASDLLLDNVDVPNKSELQLELGGMFAAEEWRYAVAKALGQTFVGCMASEGHKLKTWVLWQGAKNEGWALNKSAYRKLGRERAEKRAQHCKMLGAHLEMMESMHKVSDMQRYFYAHEFVAALKSNEGNENKAGPGMECPNLVVLVATQVNEKLLEMARARSREPEDVHAYETARAQRKPTATFPGGGGGVGEKRQTGDWTLPPPGTPGAPSPPGMGKKARKRAEAEQRRTQVGAAQPQSVAASGGAGGGGAGGSPSKTAGPKPGPSSIGCFNCKSHDHISRNCPLPRVGDGFQHRP